MHEVLPPWRQSRSVPAGRRVGQRWIELPLCIGLLVLEYPSDYADFGTGRGPSLGWTTCVFPPEMTLCAAGCLLGPPGLIGRLSLPTGRPRAASADRACTRPRFHFTEHACTHIL